MNMRLLIITVALSFVCTTPLVSQEQSDEPGSFSELPFELQPARKECNLLTDNSGDPVKRVKNVSHYPNLGLSLVYYCELEECKVWLNDGDFFEYTSEVNCDHTIIRTEYQLADTESPDTEEPFS